MSDIIVFALQGLSCTACVKRVKNALEAVDTVTQAEVTLTQASVYGQAKAAELIAAINQAGYQATTTDMQLAARCKVFPRPDPAISLPVLNPSTIKKTKHCEDNSIQLLLNGITCASCVNKVQNALQAVKGVGSAQVNLAERTALIIGTASTNDLINAVVKAGYGAEVIQDEVERRQRQQQISQKNISRYRWQSLLALAVAVPMMAWSMFDSRNMMVTVDSRLTWIILGLLTLVVLVLAGGHFFLKAVKDLINRTASMDTLVALGTGTAWIYSMLVTLWPSQFPLAARHVYFEASVMIIGLINLGHLLEQRARLRSSKALEQLLDLTPAMACVVSAEGEKNIPLAEVEVGMVLRLMTGDRVPVDGEIIKGEIWLNESMLTGEATAQKKSIGEQVHAGTTVNDGSVLFRSAAIGQQTTLARIIKLVRQAQTSKPKIGQLVDRISAVFVPIVIIIAILSATIWYLIGPSPSMIYAFTIATTVLIIACPCALGLATPMSIIAGVGRAAKFGVLVRDADALQQASEVDTIVFDKTGTLTQGAPWVTAIYTFNQHTQLTVLSWAGALEQGANHPIARAILAKAEGLALVDVSEFKTLAGLGVSGISQQKRLLLGNKVLLSQHEIDTSAAELVMEAEAVKGATVVLLAVDGQLSAVFAIRDPLRSDSIDALARLRRQGYRLVMLTGDNPITANAIASEINIDQVIAGVLPDGKLAVISALQAQGHKVMMVGDGINDAPALAQANVGIAMGGGNDIAVETAAITLMRQSIQGVADALALAKATLKNMKQNLFGAFIYNLLSIPIAAGILYPLTGMLLNPMIAGAAMAMSSITVVTNANRLLKFTPKE